MSSEKEEALALIHSVLENKRDINFELLIKECYKAFDMSDDELLKRYLHENTDSLETELIVLGIRGHGIDISHTVLEDIVASTGDQYFKDILEQGSHRNCICPTCLLAKLGKEEIEKYYNLTKCKRNKILIDWIIKHHESGDNFRKKWKCCLTVVRVPKDKTRYTIEVDEEDFHQRKFPEFIGEKGKGWGFVAEVGMFYN